MGRVGNGSRQLSDIKKSWGWVWALQSELAAALALDEKKGAAAARMVRLQTMVTVRKLVDSIEAVVPPHLWTLATYQELMFLDQTTE